MKRNIPTSEGFGPVDSRKADLPDKFFALGTGVPQFKAMRQDRRRQGSDIFVDYKVPAPRQGQRPGRIQKL
jgi:hypothetical protein